MALLESVFNHLVLPPKLPGHRDVDIEAIQLSLINRLMQACSTLGELTSPGSRETWASVSDSLRTCLGINHGRLEKASLIQSFSNLQPSGLLILFVVEQNAALLIRRWTSEGVDSIIFEAFEVSPCSEDVLAAESSLQWDFPGRAVKIPLDEFLKNSFQTNLAVFLEQASMEPLNRFEAHSAKAKVSVIEARDTTNPALITQMLMPLLEAIGSSVDVPRLRKRVRDDINIQNAEFPWRRLPFWLVLRVAIQRQLCLVLGNEAGCFFYKILICVVLAQFLEECTCQLAPELTIMLRAKLCRRLAKLEVKKSHVDSGYVVYKQLFDEVGPIIKGIIENATGQVESAWENFKAKIERSVPTSLPAYADKHALNLSLPNSQKYLVNLLDTAHQQQIPNLSQQINCSVNGTMRQVTEFTECYFSLARLEETVVTKRKLLPESIDECETCCVELSESIFSMFYAVGDAYDSNPEQMSILILNLFDLWVQMDRCAIRACPLLNDYAPAFNPELLDVLQLPRLLCMQRLQDIQNYLRHRRDGCRFSLKTVFSEPDESCFAALYVEQSPMMRRLLQQIEQGSRKSRQRKRSEWEEACKKYENLRQKIESTTCVCTIDDDGKRNVSGCTKCWHWRCQNRMKITVHEDFLPKDNADKAAVVLELQIPKFFAAYRNATFKILSDLGHPGKSKTSQPAMLLKDYGQLQNYLKSNIEGVSLASEKKSFLQTHFKGLRMKVDLSDIILPLGSEFSYYDIKSGVWLKHLDKQLTFHHLCRIHIPRSLTDLVSLSTVHPVHDFDGPSSYEIVASQTRCPSNTSIHEFMSYQRLLSGKVRRWFTMLVELGASNLNFSTEDTMLLYNHLAVQAGPTHNNFEPLRDTHFVFRDPNFCQRLVEQIDKRLRNLNSNWREIHCMEILITLSLRLSSLTSGHDHQSAEKLLKIARKSTLRWISHLVNEIRNATGADAAERAAQYGFWAALLCRRTFANFADTGSVMDAEDLCSFFQASIALQGNLVGDLSKLPLSLKNMLVRDVKMAYHMQTCIQASIKLYPESLGAAISKTCFNSDNHTGTIYSRWEFLSVPNSRWVVSAITNTANGVSQKIKFNFVEGHLLIDGTSLGKLPLEIRESEDVKELFGNQHLLTFPSSMPGMSHVMATSVRNHEIHFGLRGGSVIIRARFKDNILEFIPRRLFTSNFTFDLPLALIDDCVHWLNLYTECVEIRRKPFLWKTRPSDWILDVRNSHAYRNKVALVDPNSNICKVMAGIFRHFADAQRLTVFQPEKGRLSVEMRHLELSFYVNERNLLECRELCAEIDTNQDAGTLYGFQSMIVIRDVANTERRSIITPLGALTCIRQGMHHAVRASSSTVYGRFGIDKDLRRLSCPPEPRLLYSKAQFHAFTSFVLPDPLTGRTGTEEALHTLRSGNCQPWAPIANIPASILEAIARLSPSREYYPKDKKKLQTVNWDQNFTMCAQHDSYESVIRKILAKSDRLTTFTAGDDVAGSFETYVSSHLRNRGEIRRCLYERPTLDSGRSIIGKDTVYNPRDRHASLPQAANVYQIVRLIRKQSFRTHMTRDLAAVLQEWESIGGFNQTKPDAESIGSCLMDWVDVNVAEKWGSLVDICRNTSSQDIYYLIFRLGLLSFAKKPDMDVIRSLAAFGRLDELKILRPPLGLCFTAFELRASPTRESLLKLISADYPPVRLADEKIKRKRKAIQNEHRMQCEATGRSLASFILEQWPNSEPSAEAFKSNVLDIELIMVRIKAEWQRLHQNSRLSDYIIEVQKILDCYEDEKDWSIPSPWNKNILAFRTPRRECTLPSLSDLLVKRAPMASSHFPPRVLQQELPQFAHPPRFRDEVSENTHSSREIEELGEILKRFTQSHDVLRQQYGNDLKKSLLALSNTSSQLQLSETLLRFHPVVEGFNGDVQEARAVLNRQFECIQKYLSAKDDRFQWLQLSNLWPCTTPITILETLRSSSGHHFGSNMKEALVAYGVQVTILQRALRVRNAQLKKDHSNLFEELRNTGHENWSPLKFSDWLLLEIECNLLIRCEQIDVAHAIISPASSSNSVLQLNMGKGKTSCIVPMAVAILADKTQLLRLVVPKALLLQTAQTIQSRLGGLVGREIRHIPFSRRTSTKPSMLQLYSDHHHEILRCCGIILTTPEHILSYKLSGLQRLVDSRLSEAQEMIKFQSWLSNVCRDVLDESDFTLAVKTQLIYPSGSQISVDGHPSRWEIPQILLSLVEDHLPGLQHEFPGSINVVKRRGGFPLIHFLRTDVEDALHDRIIEKICNGALFFLRLADSTSCDSRLKMKRVLSNDEINAELIEEVSSLFSDRSAAHKNILIVRGFLSRKILLLCLKKRWNVQYGFHPTRPPIAVPFEAKGVPSEHSEYGQPDVSILTTCLAFYYSGLNFVQFREGLQHVLSSDDPAAGYDRWTSGSESLPEALHYWNAINIDDHGQVEELWYHLRFNKGVLNHYMNNLVFPAHAKQFSVKLQACGWDIPLFSKSRADKKDSCAKTTGFSGTNDNKMLLPLNIKQDDLPRLHQTNAEVLTYLLQRRNRSYYLAASRGQRLTEIELLDKINEMEIRVLIDAGAYILEMDSQTLSKTWLDKDWKAKAAVYFGDDNRAWVQYRRDKTAVPLLATPFAESLDECLVYIDHAHTRGIDLKLPRNSRGALTLALGQTKDQTMQAAMRLRQLSTTQSVVFFAPPEVDQSIRDLCGKRDGNSPVSLHIDSSHVVCWLLEQTCCANENFQSLYLAQGIDFCNRTNAEWRFAEFLTRSSDRKSYLGIIQHPECQTLEHLYGAAKDTQRIFVADMEFTELQRFMEELGKQKRTAKCIEDRACSSVLEEVEQEQEIEHQVEQVRQVQYPTHYKALLFPGLNPAISHFAKTGELAGKHGYEHVFDALAQTSVGQKHIARRTTSQLYVSAEFMRSIKLRKRKEKNFLHRPVEWILWSPQSATALVIISEEVELLIPIIRTAKNPLVHLITYAAPITKNMQHFNGLSYYVVPPLPDGYMAPDWLSIELGILAGRLYFKFSEYESLRDYLQLAEESSTEKSQTRCGTFITSPIDFLREWLMVYRKGQDIMYTPMGYICQGRPLSAIHPFFAVRSEDETEVGRPLSRCDISTDDEADDRSMDLD